MSKTGTKASDNVIIKIEGPEKIASASKIGYQIILENKEQVALREVELVVRFPQGFYFKTSEPEPEHAVALQIPDEISNEAETKTTSDSAKTPTPALPGISRKIQRYVWTFPFVGAGENLEVKVVGQMFGELAEKKIATSELFYRLENFSSEFKAVASFESEVTENFITIEIKGQEKALANQELEYVVRIEQLSSVEEAELTSEEMEDILKSLKIFIEYPKEFEISKVSPEAIKTSGEEYWQVDDLKEPYEITISGVLSGESGAYRELKVRTGFYLEEEFKLQAEESFLTLLLEPKLNLELKANDLVLAIYPLDWGEEIEYTLAYKNNGNLGFEDLVLKLSFEGDPIIDWASFSCGESRSLPKSSEDVEYSQESLLQSTSSPGCEVVMSKGGVIQGITWRQEHIPNLASLSPNESGEINFNISLLSERPLGKKENYHLQAQATLEAELKDFEQGYKAESNFIDARVRTKIGLTVEARYFTDEYLKIGFGPLPPRVGETTTYRIFWELRNTSNKLTNVQVYTTLPQGVTWPGETQIATGEIAFEEESGQVVWSIPEVKAYTGKQEGEIHESRFPNRIQANFELAVTPKENERGQYLVLTQETIALGTDDFTQEEVGDRVGYLTSGLENDLGAYGKGVVE